MFLRRPAETWMTKRLQMHCPRNFLLCLVSCQWSLPTLRHGWPGDFWRRAGIPLLGRSDAGTPVRDGGGASRRLGPGPGSSVGPGEE